MEPVAIIPARLESSRLPRKLLLNETGKTLLQHTWENAKSCSCLSEVYIATDSTEISNIAHKFGAKVIKTGEHPNGTSRIAEAVSKHPNMFGDVVVNIQGDEPEIHESMIRLVCYRLDVHDTSFIDVNTLRVETQIASDSSCVKVVCDQFGRALYFSRFPIPYALKNSETKWYKHIGVYAYRKKALEKYAVTRPSPLEKAEKLEQLRFLEMGMAIRAWVVSQECHKGIDTQHDYDEFVKRMTCSTK